MLVLAGVVALMLFAPQTSHAASTAKKKDLCLNLPSKQAKVPKGMKRNIKGNCTKKSASAAQKVAATTAPDKCSNIVGTQPSIPTGTTQYNGACYANDTSCSKKSSDTFNVIYATNDPTIATYMSGCGLSNYTITTCTGPLNKVELSGDKKTFVFDLSTGIVSVRVKGGNLEKTFANPYFTCAPADVCSNIAGNQSSVPSGYFLEGTACIQDACPNLTGGQSSVPSGYFLEGGNCVVDACPNLSGGQSSVPNGYFLEGTSCVQDACPNLTGGQSTVPNGYFLQAGSCVQDVCPNLTGGQSSVPTGYFKNSSGNCVVDQCPNIAGNQETVPSGMIKEANGNCVTPPVGAPTQVVTCDSITVNYNRALTNGDHINATITPGGQVNMYVDLNIAGGYNTMGLRWKIFGVDKTPIPLTQAQVQSGIITFNYGSHLTQNTWTVSFVQSNSTDTWPNTLCDKTPPPVDACPNLTGMQNDIPSGMIIDSSGNCVTPVDQCSNIEGMQHELPNGMFINNSGDCVQDVCPNLSGGQASVPVTMYLQNGNCVPKAPGSKDVCPNIPGDQDDVPEGMVILGNGSCVDWKNFNTICVYLSYMDGDVTRPTSHWVNDWPMVIDLYNTGKMSREEATAILNGADNEYRQSLAALRLLTPEFKFYDQSSLGNLQDDQLKRLLAANKKIEESYRLKLLSIRKAKEFLQTGDLQTLWTGMAYFPESNRQIDAAHHLIWQVGWESGFTRLPSTLNYYLTYFDNLDNSSYAEELDLAEYDADGDGIYDGPSGEDTKDDLTEQEMKESLERERQLEEIARQAIAK